jgi:hypothetical protein
VSNYHDAKFIKEKSESMVHQDPNIKNFVNGNYYRYRNNRFGGYFNSEARTISSDLLHLNITQ